MYTFPIRRFHERSALHRFHGGPESAIRSDSNRLYLLSKNY